ncbi:MAG: dTMP kinase [Betaproteobacteria bacterium]|nr:dTMP kinase [Betaproteobacteria bacterium]
MRGKFITLEGIDGAGKSTHLDWLARFLANRGITVKVTREPGGTALGEKLRQLMLHGEARLHPETETLLMFAARREHLEQVILPALASGTWVVCDRFTDATYAYQSGGSGVPWDKVAALEQWVQQGLQPDVTVIFDVAPEVGRARAAKGKSADRFEREPGGFHERVRQGYLRRAKEAPRRVHVIDANAAIAEVHKKLVNIFISFCSE